MITMAKKSHAKFWQDTSGRNTITQVPNRWAVLAIIGWVIARTFQDSGLLDFIGYAIFYPAAGYWAYLEITDGDSQFRRWLGGLVALWAVWSFINRLV